uniref:ATP synthase complex subunit 8 n=1 Tax=Pedioplanis laticeps TaxID=410870 RepID=A0A8A3WM41_9SAUR|nr:ATP synthase F0 subunit 8 [Pedioplanis laticeps]QTA72633.1 ATP synthase F0 subunit 8 [Pedioplanis laticeps]
MPQLNPSPWFLVYLLAWLTFILLLNKTLKTYPKFSTLQHNQNLLHHAWTWPWP